MEVRKIWTSTEINDFILFPHCGQVAHLQRYRQQIKSGKLHKETVCLISSLSPAAANPERLLCLARGPWGIENKSHYVRDVTFEEDRSQIRKNSGPRMMATLRNFAVSLLRLIGYENIASALRDMAAKPHLSLRLIGI